MQTTLYSIVRPPSESYVDCVSNHPLRNTIDFNKALEQHENYKKCLEQLGCKIIELPPLEGAPDSCFVEDRCVVSDGTAAICPSHLKARRGEKELVVKTISNYKQLKFLKKPGHVDGGDIIIIGDRLYGGLSKRSNLEGLLQLTKILHKQLIPMEVPEHVLHLKTVASYAGKGTVLAREDVSHLWKDAGFNIIEVPMSEPDAANCISIGNKVLIPEWSPITWLALKELGFDILEIDTTEFNKGDGSLTCLSVIFEG